MMSTLGGIYDFDNALVDKRLLIMMGNALAGHGVDGGSEFSLGSIGMVYRAFHTNKKSREEIQPLVSRNGDILCWDGRLDNRDDLLTIVHDELTGVHTDVEMVFACYRKWRNDFLPRIIGDFALSLWDSTQQALLLARDSAGSRPLFYHTDNDRIIWSSELLPLLDLAGVRLEVDDEYVAGYLTRGPRPELTPYKGVRCVAPGTSLVVRNRQIQIRRFWALETQNVIRYKTDAEYEEHFRYLFDEAVRCRLRADGPVWASLSGGLDSSSIVCTADKILKKGQGEASKLETVSYVYDESTSSDEREYIRCIEEKLGRTASHWSRR
jgi:asparagine synthase (glutamine-hydrolysing)